MTVTAEIFLTSMLAALVVFLFVVGREVYRAGFALGERHGMDYVKKLRNQK